MEDLRYVSKYTGERIDELLGKVEGMAAEAEAIAKEAAKEEALPYAQRAESASLQVQNMSVSAVQIESNQTADVAKEVMEDGSVRLKFSIPKGTYIQDIQKTAGTGSPGTKDTYTVSLSDGATFDFEVYNGEDGNGSGDFKKDGTVAMQADINMDGFGLKNLRKPTMETDCVRVVDMKEMATQNIVNAAAGTYISVADSRNAEPVEFNLFGKSTQETTTGAQLFDASAIELGNNDTLDVTDDGYTIIAIGGTKAYASSMVYFDMEKFRGKNVYIMADSIEGDIVYFICGSASASFNKTLSTTVLKGYVTIPDDVTSLFLRVYTNSKSTALTKTVTTTVKGLRIVESETAPWEPYTGGIPSPNPSYPQEIKSVGDGGNIGVTVCGKNLIPKGYTSKTTNGLTFTVNDDGSVTVNGTAESNTGFNIIREYEIHGDIIISGCPSGGSTKTYSIYAQNYDFTGNAMSETGEGKLIKKSDFDKPIILRIWILAGQTVSNLVFKPMIRLASIEDDTYEPYTAKQLTISTPNGLPGLEVTDPSLATYTDADGKMWCADYVDFERGVYVQRVIEVSFDGSSEIKERFDVAQTPATNVRFDLTNANIKNIARMPAQSKQPILSNYEKASVTINSTGVWLNMAVDYFDGRISTDSSIASNAEEFKELLSANPIKFIVPLAEPIETTLTAEELEAYAAIHMNKPNTTVMNSDGAYMAMKYLRDIDDETTSYLLRKIKELKTLINSMKG